MPNTQVGAILRVLGTHRTRSPGSHLHKVVLASQVLNQWQKPVQGKPLSELIYPHCSPEAGWGEAGQGRWGPRPSWLWPLPRNPDDLLSVHSRTAGKRSCSSSNEIKPPLFQICQRSWLKTLTEPGFLQPICLLRSVDGKFWGPVMLGPCGQNRVWK